MLTQYEKDHYLEEGREIGLEIGFIEGFMESFMESREVVSNFICEYEDTHPDCTWEDILSALEARFPKAYKRYLAKHGEMTSFS